MIRHFKTFVICICLLNSFYLPFSFLEAAPSFLSDKHKVAGISCEGCHKEDPPKDQVPTPVCYGCHGDQAKLANRTQKVIPNPHESHLGEVKCELCHHAHKPSKNYCSTCHEFNFEVP
ncbi:MAG: cytochrome c3 family protein [Thermodesulfobacteriota bacterium]